MKGIHQWTMAVAAVLLGSGLAACQKQESSLALDPHSDASPAVQAFHAKLVNALQLTNQLESDPRWNNTQKGLIAKPTGQVRNAEGQVVWDFEAFDFVKGQAPATANPSLWRQAVLNNQVGLFKVRDGVYQLRGFDLSNMTLIEGKTGWIVVDTLTAEETARAAMDFVKTHLGDKPVSAVVFTHSHVDHFGGILGVISADEAKTRQVPVVAPSGFMEEATSENVLMGSAMARRSVYMYGNSLPRNDKGLIDNGLGKAVAYGKVGILEPNLVVAQAQETHVIDGVTFEFHNVPGSEAPSEFVFYVPELKTFGGAELFSHTLHNIYTLRGAKVRDALKWQQYMGKAMDVAAQAEVLVLQHNWPVWGQDNIQEFMGKQRSIYKFMHDQTVRWLNHGYTPQEVADRVKLPNSLDTFLSARGFYGTVPHNVKGIAQFYMGWYDANPANLNPIPPADAAKRYVELAGGADNMLKAAQKAYDLGDYRWAAELGKQLVYADANNQAARALQAKTLEQMGYMAESGPWRNAYLTGAQELRLGSPKTGFKRTALLNMLQNTPTERFLEAMAASVNADKADDKNIRIKLHFTDLNETHLLHLKDGVLLHRTAIDKDTADATLKLTKPFFLQMVLGEAGAVDLLTSDQTKIEGSSIKLGQFFGVLDKADGLFNIVFD